ncbi:MAG: phenylalanine--tRNA ligase subunit beta [Candidatus Margulisiibacteriota bacterium]|nr:phenylalanine--tRNA ligase subunit beta [Candidatus Margulisiibacteriota bacterium]
MKVPIEWLKELVNIKGSPDKLAHMMTMGGLETVVEPGNLLEIDILPNRSDCWSILGIAREVAALTKTTVKRPEYRVVGISKKVKDAVTVEVKDKKLCPRYMARVIENVTIEGSPDWLKKRLESAGVRAINNVVDVTNYFLLELGQPMHAFDAKLIKDRTIIVREAKPGEKITTLDGKEHELSSDMLMITDPEKLIAIAGVMGAANTEVNGQTKTVILESAYFDPVSINNTSKNIKLRSESSVRFEHGVGWAMVEEALDRAAIMIAELAGGSILAGKIDKKTGARKPKTIKFRPERVNQVLGTNLSAAEMQSLLKRLGFSVSGNKVKIPLFRAEDISREIDLIEEIARVYGYDKIEPTMPNTSFPGKGVDKLDLFRNKVREIMIGCGLNEVQTFSMVGPKEFERTGTDPSKAVKIANPMCVEESLMRTILLPSLLNVVEHNINRQVEDVFIFEIGKIYAYSGGKLPAERWGLTVTAIGSPFMSAIDKGKADYFYIKGILQNLLDVLGIKDHKLVESDSHLVQPGRGASIAGLGLIGELHPSIRKKYKIEKQLSFFGIDLEGLFKLVEESQRYKPLPKFPSASRDIAMNVPKGLENQMIISTIKKLGGDMVEAVFLFDKYKDSLAYRVIFRNPERTLTDDEVNKKHAQIIKALESKLNVRLRR